MSAAKQALHRLIQTGAQYGVHDESGPGQTVHQGIEVGFVGDLHHLQAVVAQNLQVYAGVTSHLVPLSQQENGHRFAGLGQVAGHHEAVAAVVAPAGQHRYLPIGVGKFPPQHLVGGAPGVFHQHQGGDTHLFYGAAVQFPHLRGSDQFHDLTHSWNFIK